MVTLAAIMKFRYRIIFTPVGAAVFVIVFVMLIRSLAARNSYEIVIALAALLLLLFLGITGWWKSRKLQSLEPGWKLPFPMTANAKENALVSFFDTPVPLFFRLHFIIRGKFFPGGFGSGNSRGWCPVLAETSAARTGTANGAAAVEFPFDFPMSGVFTGDGFCRMRDIFGLFSFPCGITQRRTIKVRSAPCFGKKLRINPQSGAEDKRNKTSSNEERYYMREYTPGDRFRDINWKSSEKIDTLITRISPDNQEKVSRIEVFFRNYGSGRKEASLEEIWLLDRAKSRLSHFLRCLKEEQSSYIFHVHAAEGSWEIEDQEDLDAFLEDLAGISFYPPQNETMSPAGAGDMYIFSTACDLGLNSFILACNPRPVSLFIIQPAKVSTVSQSKKDIQAAETLRIVDFIVKGCIPLPRWFIKRKVKPLGVLVDKADIIYAEKKL
jgi:hypothetical protein